MTCPACGREASGSETRCTACGTSLPGRTAPAIGVAALTPPPAAPSGDDETRLATGSGAAASAGASRAVGASSTGPLSPGQNFGTRYHVIRLLGAGGMGAVYQAWDAELGVAVALKVIRPEALADAETARDLERRFKRELLLARQVTHKHVVRIHDLGEIDGIKYLTMPYVDGENLESVMRREGARPVRWVLALARQIAAGLEAAHDAGVVHRDLKPANIMVDRDGNALIMDFGIARTADPSTLATAATAPGGLVGTIEYMAPEQATGQPVDARADIYAFGLILYDLLLGPRRRASAESAISDLMQRVQQAPPPLRAVDPSLPDALERIVARCLEPDPARRYPATAALAADLARLDADGRPLVVPRPVRRWRRGLAAAALLAIGSGVTWLTLHLRPPANLARPPDPVSVLVADFVNRTGDPVFDGALEQALGIGIEGAAFVMAYPRREAVRAAATLAPGRPLDEAVARLVAVREGVKVVLTGTIEPAGAGYRLTVRALDPAAGTTLGTQTMRAETKGDVLQRMGVLAARMRGALGDPTPESARLAAGETFTTGSLEAMAAYVRGQDLAAAGRYADAEAAYEAALRHDPQFGRAYIGLGALYRNLGREEEAHAAYKRGLALLDRMSERERYRTLGTYYLGVTRNYEEAIETYEQLIARYPADNVAYGNLALAYLWTGDIGRALAVGRKAVELSPRNLMQRTNYAMYALYAGEVDTARAEAERVLQENPAYEFAHLPVALASALQGQFDRAEAAYRRLAGVSALGATLARLGEADLALAYGRPREALAALADAAPARAGATGSSYEAHRALVLSEAALAAGDRARAAEWARRALSFSRHEAVQFAAARALLAAGRREEVLPITRGLESRTQPQAAAYSRLLAGEVALAAGRPAAALEAFRDARARHDSWFARFLLARAYFEAGQAAEALDELELCLKRRGETADVFFIDVPTLRYLPPVHYWLGRAQEQLGLKEAAARSYREFLAFRPADSTDPRALDARQRLAR